MQYNQPFDQPSNLNAPYIDGNPAAGIQGSIVPAEAIEFDQREVVEVITRANARNYIDFSGTPCAPPANPDLNTGLPPLQQLRKAIEGFIRAWDFIIDTTITFHVHGVGADFPDFNQAMQYLRRYYITTNGHVILQSAGALPARSKQPNTHTWAAFGLVTRTTIAFRCLVRRCCHRLRAAQMPMHAAGHPLPLAQRIRRPISICCGLSLRLNCI